MGEIINTDSIVSDVTKCFSNLVSALNNMDITTWAAFYSDESFVSTIAGTEYFQSKIEWVEAISNYFSLRQTQIVTPVIIRVTPLAADLAYMTSEEKSEILLKNGERVTVTHVFTMIWKKEASGWKILHSHESWTPA